MSQKKLCVIKLSACLPSDHSTQKTRVEDTSYSNFPINQQLSYIKTSVPNFVNSSVSHLDNEKCNESANGINLQGGLFGGFQDRPYGVDSNCKFSSMRVTDKSTSLSISNSNQCCAVSKDETFIGNTSHGISNVYHEEENVNNEWKDQVNVCSICNQTFAHRSTLRQHYIIHTGEKPHECNYCGKTFVKKFSLNQHLRLHTGNLPFKCDQCDKKFNTKANYESHYYIHTGGYPFVCDICNAGFRKKSKLHSHYDIHSNPAEEAAYIERTSKAHKNKECNVCGKKFSKPFKLKEHYRIHTGEKPFHCEDCGKSFSQKTLLKTHSYTHTHKYPYHCYVCNKGFRDSCRLKTHFSNHHSVS